MSKKLIIGLVGLVLVISTTAQTTNTSTASTGGTTTNNTSLINQGTYDSKSLVDTNSTHSRSTAIIMFNTIVLPDDISNKIVNSLLDKILP